MTKCFPTKTPEPKHRAKECTDQSWPKRLKPATGCQYSSTHLENTHMPKHIHTYIPRHAPPHTHTRIGIQALKCFNFIA